MWKLLRHHGVPEKKISLIRCTFQDMSCRIAHAGQLSESFESSTGVPAFTVPLPPDHRLDHEDHYNR